MRRGRALDPAAAVVVDEQRAGRRGAVGDVEPRGQRPGGPGDGDVAGVQRQARPDRDAREVAGELRAHLVDRERADGDRLPRGEPGQEPCVGLEPGGVRRGRAGERRDHPRREREQHARQEEEQAIARGHRRAA